MPRFKFSFLPNIPIPGPQAIKDAIGDRCLFRTTEPLQQNSEGDETGFIDIYRIEADHDNATAVTSLIKDSDLHAPVIDIDLPCMLVPSSQPGHFHLYINQEMPWEKFVAILEALEDARVIGPGYLQYTKKRGFATVRYPGVTKNNERDRINEGMTDAEREARDAELKELEAELGLDFL